MIDNLSTFFASILFLSLVVFGGVGIAMLLELTITELFMASGIVAFISLCFGTGFMILDTLRRGYEKRNL